MLFCQLILRSLSVLRNNLVFCIPVFFIITGSFSIMKAHHTGSGSDGAPNSNARFIDPFTGKREKPANYGIMTYDLQKGERKNRNVHTVSAFGEVIFGEGQFALNATASYIYYDQKDRSDAARIGKVYLGAKYLPFFSLDKNYFFVLEGRLGFPSGPDTDRFAGGNYYTGTANFTAGYKLDKFAFIGKISGIFPLSKLSPNNSNNDDGIPYYLRTSVQSQEHNEIQLKKAGVYSVFINYFAHPNISLFTGFLYRTPYYGVEKETSTADRIPAFYKEGSIGISYNFSEKYTLSTMYRYPIDRGREFRPYESALTTAFTMEF
ncbi:MAG TPA: hypothetical protein PKK94_07550 [Leptospiraceae bacterium]|nr:hypothetical protein [Leptospiraceae bacterium]